MCRGSDPARVELLEREGIRCPRRGNGQGELRHIDQEAIVSRSRRCRARRSPSRAASTTSVPRMPGRCSRCPLLPDPTCRASLRRQMVAAVRRGQWVHGRITVVMTLETARPSEGARGSPGSWPTNSDPRHKRLQNTRLRLQSRVPTPLAIELGTQSGGAGGCLRAVAQKQSILFHRDNKGR